MKIKSAATFLMIGSILAILTELYWTYKSFSYYSNDLLELMLRFMYLSLPVALLFLAIALRNDSFAETSWKADDRSIPAEQTKNLSVGDWLVNYLILVIPIVGLVFIIIWANDENNKIRKNWAVASLIWAAILFVLSLFLYAALYAAIRRGY